MGIVVICEPKQLLCCENSGLCINLFCIRSEKYLVDVDREWGVRVERC